MVYDLEKASEVNRAWLDQLRRDSSYDLFMATFGDWDEERHKRHCDECWQQGGVFLVIVGGSRVGMIQLFERKDAIEIGEIQIHPSHQNQRIGTQLLEDVMAKAHQHGKSVVLSVALKNERAYRLYERLGFHCTGRNDTHHHMQRLPSSSGGGPHS